MIATRFRSVGLVMAGTAAMLSCYLVTQRVAGERAALSKIERQLLAAKRDVRRLQTEIETRSRMAQIEKWNDDVLALSAPRASQFVNGEMQLASFTKPPEPQPLVNDGANLPQPAAAIAQASYRADSEAAPIAAAPQPLLRPATYLKPKEAGATKVEKVAMLDDAIAGKLKPAAKRDASRKTDAQ